MELDLCPFAGCGATKEAFAQTATTPTTALQAEPAPELTGKAALDGKKIIFIGNSFTFFGNAVIHKKRTVLLQEQRSNDQGYFYQLCKSNGIDVSVTNWTYGTHNITDLFGGRCKVNRECFDQDHASYLTDPYFDYVAIQLFHERAFYKGDLVAHIQTATDFFRKANPNVKFLFLVPHMAHERNYVWMKDLESLKKENFLICDWGGMLYDIVEGNTEVPGAALDYARSTFVVSRTEDDGLHENLLAGYITALMVYCAITGESAVGQDYSFCDDSSINKAFHLEAFRKRNYVFHPETNFAEVFRSKPDMLGLQQLADQYLAKYNGGN